MIKKIIITIYMTVFLVAIIVGIMNKQTYTNITRQANVMEHFSVALMDSELVSSTVHHMETVLPNADIILKVKAEGEVEHMFNINKQLVSVQKIYKGKDIAIDDNIYIATYNWSFFFDDMTANMGFVNVLEKNNEYLVFIEKKVKALDVKDNNTYRLADTIISPIFNYEDKDNTFVEVSDDMGDDMSYVPYSKVSNNEFFVSSQDALDILEKLKYKLLDKYN
jgi:hypothetical protein